MNVEGTNTKFKASVKANLKSEPDVDLFIKNYGQKNNETLRILKTKKSLNENANTLVKYISDATTTRGKKPPNAQEKFWHRNPLGGSRIRIALSPWWSELAEMQSMKIFLLLFMQNGAMSPITTLCELEPN